MKTQSSRTPYQNWLFRLLRDKGWLCTSSCKDRHSLILQSQTYMSYCHTRKGADCQILKLWCWFEQEEGCSVWSPSHISCKWIHFPCTLHKSISKCLGLYQTLRLGAPNTVLEWKPGCIAEWYWKSRFECRLLSWNFECIPSRETDIQSH